MVSQKLVSCGRGMTLGGEMGRFSPSGQLWPPAGKDLRSAPGNFHVVTTAYFEMLSTYHGNNADSLEVH